MDISSSLNTTAIFFPGVIITIQKLVKITRTQVLFINELSEVSKSVAYTYLGLPPINLKFLDWYMVSYMILKPNLCCFLRDRSVHKNFCVFIFICLIVTNYKITIFNWHGHSPHYKQICRPPDHSSQHDPYPNDLSPFCESPQIGWRGRRICEGMFIYLNS